ncbi:79a1a875-59b9-4882-be98-cc65b2114b0b [Sclerotinia trifoliorum]|uniref:79a1a875-59b9-4882-be98-cc65b2114b0b n=1 Tax=Sclerotinia trifoliorum TaxID=28548 RepID=A0A8H2W5Z9_9HELO|nr:79a1a875-59b9-4882-be98-cc65b2114b0b [Sclerotinia trifoliorum]
MSESGYFNVEEPTSSGPAYDLMEDSGVAFEDEDNFPDETPGERLGAIFEDEESNPDEENFQDETRVGFEDEEGTPEESPEDRLAVKKMSLKKCAEDMVSEHSEAVALAALAKKIESGLKEVNSKLLEKNEIVQYFIKRNGELSTEIREEETNIKFFNLESSLSMKKLECEQLLEENQKLLEKIRLYEESVNDKGKIDVGALLVENSDLKRKLETASLHPDFDYGAPPHEELQSEATFVNPEQQLSEWKENPKFQEFIAEAVRSALSEQRKSMKHLFFVGQRVRNRFLERNSAYDPKVKESNAIYELGNSSVFNGRPITDATLFTDVQGVVFEKRTDEKTFKELYWASWQTVLRLQDCAEFIEMLRWHSSVKAWRRQDYMKTEFFKTWTKNIDTRFEDMDLAAVREYCTNITRKKLKACYLDEKKRNMKIRRSVGLGSGNDSGLFFDIDVGMWGGGVMKGVMRWMMLGLIVLCQFMLWMVWWVEQNDWLSSGLEDVLDADVELDLGWCGLGTFELEMEDMLVCVRTGLMLGWLVGECAVLTAHRRGWNWNWDWNSSRIEHSLRSLCFWK